MTFVPLHNELAALTAAHRLEATHRAARRAAPEGAPTDAPAFALAYRFGLRGDSLAASDLAAQWHAAATDHTALFELAAPLFALGLLAVPRDERSALLRTAPAGLEAPTRNAFLAIRELQRPDATVLSAAQRAWSALATLQPSQPAPRLLVVSTLLCALGPALPYEIDALSDAPPLVLPFADRAASEALAQWWLAHITTAVAP